ncbi:two-component system alkaline phosphatase synthesis response regulator PhoP [Desulfitispora alkaliphila]|uniref:response regulator transcription factor n=1 Tax=Desulfitispora alkaliphila TaxID=622674 RepID=UPI003D248272
MARVLVVDDEPHIVELLSFNLASMGYEISTAYDGVMAIEKVKMENPELILLDVMLPKLSGLQVCQHLRSKLNYKKPIIMISGKGEEVDKILGIEMGANDYVTKPFSPKELTARVKSNLRYNSLTEDIKEDDFSSKVLQFNSQEKSLTCLGKNIHLTPKEYELAKLLSSNPGKALRREYLINYIWGSDYKGDLRTLDVHIRYLRQKLSSCTACDIATVRGYGYRMDFYLE